MCGSLFRPKVSLPPAPPPPPVATVEVKQGSARPAGFSEGRSLNVASSYDRKRIGSSKLRIPIIGGV